MQKPIIFFDGVCGLCHRFIQFVFAKDRQKLFLVSPLQGKEAAKRLSEGDVNELRSVVLLQNGNYYRASDAVIRILFAFGGLWKAAIVLLVIPKSIREAVYNFVAARRYGWFGKTDVCQLPSPDQSARFLP